MFCLSLRVCGKNISRLRDQKTWARRALVGRQGGVRTKRKTQWEIVAGLIFGEMDSF